MLLKRKKVLLKCRISGISDAAGAKGKAKERWIRMKLLFLCSRNKRRSLTAERIFDGYQGHEARSAGTEVNARIKVTEGLLGWADIIFCMEKKHYRRIKEKYADSINNKQVVCLYIHDDYDYMDEELIDVLEGNVKPWIVESHG